MNQGNKSWLERILVLLKKKIDSKHDAEIYTTKTNAIHAISTSDAEDGEFIITFAEGESVTEVE